MYLSIRKIFWDTKKVLQKCKSISNKVNNVQNDLQVTKETVLELKREIQKENGKYLDDPDAAHRKLSLDAAEEVSDLVLDDLGLDQDDYDVKAVCAPAKAYVSKRNVSTGGEDE